MFGCSRTVQTVSRQGSLSYFEGAQLDHRGLYVDTKLGHIFGSTVNDQTMASLTRIGRELS